MPGGTAMAAADVAPAGRVELPRKLRPTQHLQVAAQPQATSPSAASRIFSCTAIAVMRRPWHRRAALGTNTKLSPPLRFESGGRALPAHPLLFMT